MRLVALLVLLALNGPATAAVVCDLWCVKHDARHEALLASHEHDGTRGASASLEARASTCHTRAESGTIVSIAASTGVSVTAGPGIVQTFRAASFEECDAASSACSLPPRPRHGSLTITPLRI